MNKFVRFIQSYLLIGLPFVIICMFWSTVSSQNEVLMTSGFFTKALWHILAFNLMLWFLILISFLILLVLIPEVREKTLRRLANLKERDEREEYITGKAARTVYISTLSLTLLLLFFSLFTFSIYSIPKNATLDGKQHLSVNVGLHFNLLEKPTIKSSPSGTVIFDSSNIPLSKSALIFMLLSWQLIVFNFTARRISK